MSEMNVFLRAPRAGDGDGLARCWLDAGAYYAAANPELFQVPVTFSDKRREIFRINWRTHRTLQRPDDQTLPGGFNDLLGDRPHLVNL